MIRSEYIDTEEGQWREYQRRSLERQGFLVSSHEPKSKTGITELEKAHFQKAIADQMKQFRRRAYRSPVVLEIDFHSQQNDPPAVHTLAKNYMDLLQKPVEGSGIRRKHLLLSDDRLIDVLIVNHHLRRLPTPEVHLQVDTVANFASDLALLDRIRHRRFGDATDYDVHAVWDASLTLHGDDDLGDALRALREWERDRASVESRWGPGVYQGIDRMNRMRAQECYLAAAQPKVEQLIWLLGPLIDSGSHTDGLTASMRNMIVNPPLMLDLTHAPVEGAGKEVFKASVNKALSAFKDRHSLLFPLLTTIGVTIICVPPKAHATSGKEQYVDLDNLARYVIPAVHDILKPPADAVHTFDLASITDESLRQSFEQRLSRLRRMPKHSIVRYEMVRLPRLPSDPDNGLVRLVLGEGELRDGLWDQIDKIIERWGAN